MKEGGTYLYGFLFRMYVKTWFYSVIKVRGKERNFLFLEVIAYLHTQIKNLATEK